MGAGSTIGAGIGTAVAPGAGTLIGAGLGSLAEGVYDWWQGDNQKEQIAALEKNNIRPDFVIPQSEKDALDNAKAMAGLTRLPGQSGIEGRQDRAAADEVAFLEKNGVGGSQTINGAGRVYGNLMDKENELGVEAARFHSANQEKLRSEQHNMAEWENRKWDWDTGQPYTTKQKAIAALKGAQLHNQEQGFKNFAGGITMGITGLGDNFDWWNTGAKSNNTSDGAQTDGNGNWFMPTSDNTGAPEYGQDYSNYTDKMLNSAMGFFNGSN